MRQFWHKFGKIVKNQTTHRLFKYQAFAFYKGHSIIYQKADFTTHVCAMPSRAFCTGYPSGLTICCLGTINPLLSTSNQYLNGTTILFCLMPLHQCYYVIHICAFLIGYQINLCKHQFNNLLHHYHPCS